MNRPAIIPPITPDDRLPDEKAVWREELPMGTRTADHQVSVDYGGAIERTTMLQVDWRRVKRWRFGWPPANEGTANA